MTETLGLMLVRTGVVRREDLYRALEMQRQSGRFLGSCLLALGVLTPEQLQNALSTQFGLPLVDGRHVLQATSGLAALVPEELVQRQRVVPFAFDQGVLQIALYEPTAAEAVSEIAFFTGKKVQAYLSDEAVVERVIATLYPALARPMARLPAAGPVPLSTPPPVPAARSPVSPPRERPASVTQVDRRRPDQILRPVQEISNRNFGGALGLDEGPAEEPILLQPKRASAVAHPVRPIQSVVEAAERVFEATRLAEVGQVVVAFLRSYFERAAAFELAPTQALTLAHFGFATPPPSLELGAYPVVAQAVAELQGVHGLVPEDPHWSRLLGQFGPPRPGVVLLAPVSDGQRARLLFYADSQTLEAYEDLHDVAVLMREVTTALGILGDPGPA